MKHVGFRYKRHFIISIGTVIIQDKDFLFLSLLYAFSFSKEFFPMFYKMWRKNFLYIVPNRKESFHSASLIPFHVSLFLFFLLLCSYLFNKVVKRKKTFLPLHKLTKWDEKLFSYSRFLRQFYFLFLPSLGHRKSFLSVLLVNFFLFQVRFSTK